MKNWGIVAMAAFTLISPAHSNADDVDNAVAGTDQHDEQASQTTPRFYPRKVYNVDDVGLIIGGASEDAKAKVGRLPVRD